MHETDTRGYAALSHVLGQTHVAGPDDLPRIVNEAAQLLGAVSGHAYLADYDQMLLVPLNPLDRSGRVVDEPEPGDGGSLDPLSIDGTVAGRSFREVAVHFSTDPPGTIWVPLLNGTERLGVLELRFPADMDISATEVQAASRQLASLLAEFVLTRRLYGDLIELTRRRLPMTLPAELQWGLLPPLTFATHEVAITGALLPTHEVAGDCFDYALNDSVLHFAVFDAMGHGLHAALVSTLAITALRNARRCGLDLLDTARSIDGHLAAQFGGDMFVTGVLGRLDCATGVVQWLNAGHPPALLLRNNRVVRDLDSTVCPPFGLIASFSATPELGQERLQPADRILLYTDGVVEARDGEGEFFGLDRLIDLVGRHELGGHPLPETLRRLSHAVLAHQKGDLTDDATTLLLEWHGSADVELQL